MRPRVLQITAERRVLPEAELRARLDALASLPEAARRGYAVQLRDPELPARALLALGAPAPGGDARPGGGARGVNDRLDLAIALGADGVHLGRRSVSVADARALLPPGTWISVACHAVGDVVRAAGEGADAALLSPIFASPGKGPPLGVEAIREARDAVGEDILLVALGGVREESAGACFAAGAGAVAGIRADLGRVLLDALAPRC